MVIAQDVAVCKCNNMFSGIYVDIIGSVTAANGC